MVPGGALVAVVTAAIGGAEGTTFLWVAKIRGAGVAVIADEQIRGHAVTTVTVVAKGADVAVVARRGVEDVSTPLPGVTVIGSAEIVVVALECEEALARSLTALVSHGACVLVVADEVGWRVQALAVQAGIGSTEVAVIALNRGPRLALGQLADIAAGAKVAVIARGGIGNECAPAPRQTEVSSAGVAVVTLHGLIGGAFARAAMVV